MGLTQLDNMSPMDIKKAISINKDPAGEQLLVALGQKISREFSEVIESNKRSRSLVISGIEETEAQLRPSERQRDLGEKVCELFLTWNVGLVRCIVRANQLPASQAR